MNFFARLKFAASLIWKGSIAPFDRLVNLGLGGSYGEGLHKPFAKSVWVMRAIKSVIDPVVAVQLRFSSDAAGGKQLVSSEGLEDYWKSPAIGPTGPLTLATVKTATIGWLKLAGECFWVFDDTVLVPSAQLPFPDAGRAGQRFLIAAPDRMRHVLNDQQIVTGWQFTDGAGRQHTLLPEQVVHLKLWNPYDPIRGLSEYEAAAIAADGDFQAGRFKRNLNASNGDQGIYIVAKNGVPTEEQRKQIVNQLRDKREMQQHGIFRPTFLTGDISIQDPLVRQVDESFNNSRIHDRHEIFIAFGVPPSMADIQASYSVGSASDRYRLIEDTCKPIGAFVCEEGIDVVSEMLFAQRVYAWLDWSQHSVMRQVQKENADTAIKYWDRGVSWEILNDMLTLGMPEFDGWDQGYLPFSVTPVGEVAAIDAGLGAGADVATDETDEGNTPAVQEMLRALRSPRQRASDRDPAEVAQWNQHAARRKAVGRMYASRFTKILFMARGEVLSKLRTYNKAANAVTRAAAMDFMFDLGKFTGEFKANMRAVGAQAISTAGQELFNEVGKDDVFSMPMPKVQEFLRGRENKLSGIPTEVFDRIRKGLEEGIQNGETTDELAKRIRTDFNDIGRGRAQVIAMTETSAAYGAARQDAMEQAGIQFKKWLTSGLPNVRPAHRAANGQVVGINESFEVGGEELDHPGDPSGAPENVINCHCVSISAAAPNETT